MALQMQQEEYGDNANIGGADQIGVPAQQNQRPVQQNNNAVQQNIDVAQRRTEEARQGMMDQLVPKEQMDAPTRSMVMKIWN